jgi:hypothetical protein
MITFVIITAIGLWAAHALARRHNAREVERAAAALGGLGRPVRLPILMPVCGRPHYLREVLAALARVEGIDRATLIVSQDGRNPEVSALIAGVIFAPVIHLRHARPFMGILAFFWDGLHAASANIHDLLAFAFSPAQAAGAIVLEDDIVPSPDFLAYFEWAFANILSDEKVLTVTGFNLHSRPWPEKGYDPRDYPFAMIVNREGGRNKFTGWSWAITRANWGRIRQSWSFVSWDIGLDALQRRLGLISYKPALARAKNIGMQGGINFTEAEGNPKWAGIHLAEAPLAYTEAPRLLDKDVAVPPQEESGAPGPGPSERERTRPRRFLLYGAVAFMAWLEWRLVALWGLS